MTAQVDTWVNHSSIRHFWGFTERDDFNLSCPLMSNATLKSYIFGCKDELSPMGWHEDYEKFRIQNFGDSSKNTGWFCAMRRPGRALGWIHTMYQNETSAMIPDFLSIVDDDTAVVSRVF